MNQRNASAELDASTDIATNFTPNKLRSLVGDYWAKPSTLVDAIVDQNCTAAPKKSIRTIAVFFHALRMGGGDRITRDLAIMWEEIGYRVIVITNTEPSEEDYPLPKTITRVSIPTFLGITKDTYAERGRALERVLIDYDVDVLVFAHWFSDVLAFDMLTAKSLGIPFFLFIQTSFTQFFLDSDMPSNYIDIPLQYKLADGIICLSEMDRLFWSKFNSNVRCTYNPITQTSPHQPSAPLAGHNIIWPARVHVDKYPLRVVPIMDALLKKVPDAKIWMVGPEDPNLKQQIIEAAEARGEAVASSIVFCGPQTEDQMPDWYRKADAFLLTSKREGWSLALAEALATGLPCVMYDLPYLTLVKGNDAIIRIPQGDGEAAADALASVLTDKDRAHEMGRAGHSYMTEIARYDHKRFWRECFASAFDRQRANASIDNNVSPLEKLMWRELLDAYRSHIESFEEERAHLVEQINENNQVMRRQSAQITGLEDYVDHILHSKSYRIGITITALPRALKRFFGKPSTPSESDR